MVFLKAGNGYLTLGITSDDLNFNNKEHIIPKVLKLEHLWPNLQEKNHISGQNGLPEGWKWVPKGWKNIH